MQYFGLLKQELGQLKSLSFVTPDGKGYTYFPSEDCLAVVPGVQGELQVALSAEAFSDFVHEILTISGLKATQRLAINTGSIDDLRLRQGRAIRAYRSCRH